MLQSAICLSTEVEAETIQPYLHQPLPGIQSKIAEHAGSMVEMTIQAGHKTGQ